MDPTAPTPLSHPAPPAGRKRALLWGAGSTVLSAAGLLGVALFEQYNGAVGDLRADLKHFNETTGEFVKKDELRRCRDQLRDVAKESAAATTDRARLEQELRASEQARTDQSREVQRLRERLAYLEGLHGGRAGSVAGCPAPESDSR